MPFPIECEVYHAVHGCDEQQEDNESFKHPGFVSMFVAVNHVLDAANGCSE